MQSELPNMKIRKAIESDCPGIARVQVDSYRTAYAPIFPQEYLDHFTYEEQEGDWRGLLASADQGTVLYVAVDDADEVIGYALGAPSSEMPPYESELVALHVCQTYQGQDVGRQLVAAVSSALYAQGCQSLFLWVLADNPARAFYEKLGGVLVGKKPWENNEYFKLDIYEMAYGWPDIHKLAGPSGS